MIIEDARRALEIRTKIKALEARCEALMRQSQIAQLVDSIPGFGLVCARNYITKTIKIPLKNYANVDKDSLFTKSPKIVEQILESSHFVCGAYNLQKKNRL